jgi:transposase-like protein
MNLIERIPARDVARMIGIKTATLAKWRRLGKGPKGWREMSPTLVTYPAEEVERFISDRRSST